MALKAAHFHNPEALEILFKNFHFDPNEGKEAGVTIFQMACLNASDRLAKTVQVLLTKGSDPLATAGTIDKTTPFELLLRQYPIEHSEGQKYVKEAMGVFIAHAKSKNMEAAILMGGAKKAVLDGRTDILEAMIDSGMDVNQKDAHGNTLLFSIFKECIAPDQSKLDPLDFGIMVCTLLERGANINVTDIEGRNLFQEAKELSSTNDIAKLIAEPSEVHIRQIREQFKSQKEVKKRVILKKATEGEMTPSEMFEVLDKPAYVDLKKDLVEHALKSKKFYNAESIKELESRGLISSGNLTEIILRAVEFGVEKEVFPVVVDLDCFGSKGHQQTLIGALESKPELVLEMRAAFKEKGMLEEVKVTLNVKEGAKEEEILQTLKEQGLAKALLGEVVKARDVIVKSQAQSSGVGEQHRGFKTTAPDCR